MLSMPQPSSVPEVIITIIAGPARGQTMKLDRTLSIGREGTDLTVADDQLSRRHVELRLAPGALGVVVEDLGSTNGTLVDGRRITGAVTVQDGATIEIGGTTLEIAHAKAASGGGSPRSPATKRNEILIRAAILLVGGIISLLLIVAQTSAEHSQSPHHISGVMHTAIIVSDAPIFLFAGDFIGGPATTGGATIDQVYLVPPGVAPLSTVTPVTASAATRFADATLSSVITAEATPMKNGSVHVIGHGVFTGGTGIYKDAGGGFAFSGGRPPGSTHATFTLNGTVNY